MKNALIFLIFCIIACSFKSDQAYDSTWESLDKRPTPSWFGDAKFGIFIHWGPYSVPAWSPKGTYSEWYQYWLQKGKIFGNGKYTNREIPDFHKNTYGEGSTYYDLGKLFKADLFDSKKWAQLFEKSGAKYVVITSKHHDGYCLWPNKEANDRGFAWNSADVGAKKDLLGEFTAAIRETDIKLGMYYSLYEWFHPWWLNDKDRFVKEHFHPQVKDLVERYQPDMLWADGEWEMSSKQWKTEELIAWLYNESSVKEKIIINDRWGQGTRHHHGGFYTTEYESSGDFDRPWEECRGMGLSFGYNRNEDIEDYNSAKALVLMLCDVVSRGGNLLLGIGPDGHGQIPPIMQERLLQIGKWLDINGEAIYGTRKWKNNTQWSPGNKNCKGKEQHYISGDYILEQTIAPLDSSCAVKEVFFTYKGGNLYAIAPKWPGKKLILRNIKTSENTKIKLLDNGKELKWKEVNGNIEISLPEYNPNEVRSDIAFVFSLSNILEYAKKPKVKITYGGFSKKVQVEILGNKKSKIYYTTDGSTPDQNSKLYKGVLSIDNTMTISCIAYEDGKNPSDIFKQEIKYYNQVKSLKITPQPHKKHCANGEISLMDNIRGSTKIKKGNWLGFPGEDVELLIDFGKKRSVNNIQIGCLQAQSSWIFAPESIEYYTSDNGRNFTKIDNYANPEASKKSDTQVIDFQKSFNNIQSRYLKIKIISTKKCPQWHDGSGKDCWLFIDELIIN